MTSSKVRQSARVLLRLPGSIRVGARKGHCDVVEVGRGGVFVTTDLEPPKRQLVQLSTTLPDGSEFCVNGMVSRIVAEDEAHRLHVAPGIGIQFYGLGETATHRWQEFVQSQLDRQKTGAQPEAPEQQSKKSKESTGVEHLAASRGLDPQILAAALADEHDTERIPKAGKKTDAGYAKRPSPGPDAKPDPRRRRKSGTVRLWTPPASRPALSSQPAEQPKEEPDELGGDTELDLPHPSRLVKAKIEKRSAIESASDDGDGIAQDLVATQPFDVVKIKAQIDGMGTLHGIPTVLPKKAVEEREAAETGQIEGPARAVLEDADDEDADSSAAALAAQTGLDPGLVAAALAASGDPRAMASRKLQDEDDAQEDGDDGAEDEEATEDEDSSVYRPPKPKYAARPDAPESSMIHIIGPKEPQPERKPDEEKSRPSVEAPDSAEPSRRSSAAKRRTTDKIAKKRLDELGQDEGAEPESAEEPGAEQYLPSLEVEIPGEADAVEDSNHLDGDDGPLSVEVELPADDADEDDFDDIIGRDTLPSVEVVIPESDEASLEEDAPHSVEVEIPDEEDEDESFVRRETTPSMKVPIIDEPDESNGQISDDRAIVPADPSPFYARAIIEQGSEEGMHRHRGQTTPDGRPVEQLDHIPPQGYPIPGLPWDPSTGLPVRPHPAMGASPPPQGYPYGPIHPAYAHQAPYALQPGGHSSGYITPMLALPPAAGLAPVEAMTHVVYRILLPSVDALEGFADTALETGGVFVRTRDIRPSGTPAVVIVVHPLSQDEFHLPGEVGRVGDHRRGVGVRFVGVTDRTVSDYRNFIVLGIPDDDFGDTGDEPPSVPGGDHHELTMLNPARRQQKDPTGSVPRDTREIDMSKVEPLDKKE